jgi:heme-degrading monooxygenase HmoA
LYGRRHEGLQLMRMSLGGRNESHMADERYTYIWEYEVPPSQEAEFLAHYAPDGAWVELFRRSPGHLATELYRDRARPERFVTIDHWRTEAAFREFRNQYAAEFEALDRQCARLTRREASLGEFRPGSTGAA